MSNYDAAQVLEQFELIGEMDQEIAQKIAERDAAIDHFNKQGYPFEVEDKSDNGDFDTVLVRKLKEDGQKEAA